MSQPGDSTLESLTIPSREAIKDAHERNQFQGDEIRVAFDRYDGHQEARVKEPHPAIEASLPVSLFIEHIDGKPWPTKSYAETTVFELDRFPDIRYEREDELEDSDELNGATQEIWEEMQERWWSEVEFLDEVTFERGNTVSVFYAEDES